jgi:hypothetical protein
MSKLDKLSKAEPVCYLREEWLSYDQSNDQDPHAFPVFTTDPRPLVALIKQLGDALEGFIENDDTPEANCSCHITPPCEDCVEYAQQRELLSNATEALAEIAAFDKED